MKQQMEIERNNNSMFLYISLLILPLLCFNMVDNIEKNSLGLRLITPLFIANLFFFIKVRRSKKLLGGEKLYTLLATTISIWFFLHCFLYVNPFLGEDVITILNKIGFDLNGSLNYKAFSFFIANLFYLVIAIIEIKNYEKDIMYMPGVIITSIFIFMYMIFNDVFIIK